MPLIKTDSGATVGTPPVPLVIDSRCGSTGRVRAVPPAYSSDAVQKCTAFHKKTGRIIKLLTVQEILDEEHVQKM